MTGRLTIKELPNSEKPYEKCINKGVEYLSDAELLAVILRTGTVGAMSTDIAQKVLSKIKPENNLRYLDKLSRKELLSIKGIGQVKALQIMCLCEIAKRINISKALEKISLNSPKSIADYYMPRMSFLTQEELIVAMFDNGNHFIDSACVFKGTVNSSLVSPREIFIEALKKEAVKIVLLHNHPGSIMLPSREDLEFTNKMVKIGDLLGLKVIDHIIIGDGSYYSFLEKGLL
ncbi:DNA repair protein RadC [Acetitomaculum ruminis DSM 5522]|uniref:DNA repair protein RadC n=1 Tax=Acetitomaculum ruminis DSM 5522 TaxID=1120918 RepID=A0A1I0V4U0_9FIRM|nr:DNA repair protein RadC [Acetitomaculum ruminis]SFA71338.1 DNA repair protein RadC [Acetitomaculum ruminis DSM 5522]